VTQSGLIGVFTSRKLEILNKDKVMMEQASFNDLPRSSRGLYQCFKTLSSWIYAFIGQAIARYAIWTNMDSQKDSMFREIRFGNTIKSFYMPPRFNLQTPRMNCFAKRCNYRFTRITFHSMLIHPPRFRKGKTKKKQVALFRLSMTQPHQCAYKDFTTIELD
jgi:hypothetical protein